MVKKLLLLQFQIFGYDFVELAQNDFHRSYTTTQIILLILLVSLENLKFLDEAAL